MQNISKAAKSRADSTREHEHGSTHYRGQAGWLNVLCLMLHAHYVLCLCCMYTMYCIWWHEKIRQGSHNPHLGQNIWWKPRHHLIRTHAESQSSQRVSTAAKHQLCQKAASKQPVQHRYWQNWPQHCSLSTKHMKFCLHAGSWWVRVLLRERRCRQNHVQHYSP